MQVFNHIDDPRDDKAWVEAKIISRSVMIIILAVLAWSGLKLRDINQRTEYIQELHSEIK